VVNPRNVIPRTHGDQSQKPIQLARKEKEQSKENFPSSAFEDSRKNFSNGERDGLLSKAEDSFDDSLWAWGFELNCFFDRE
jgi:hypothetical protein